MKKYVYTFLAMLTMSACILSNAKAETPTDKGMVCAYKTGNELYKRYVNGQGEWLAGNHGSYGVNCEGSRVVAGLYTISTDQNGSVFWNVLTFSGCYENLEDAQEKAISFLDQYRKMGVCR